ncbi:hypothetical protein [Bradyrhizobium sp. BR 1433]|uniref:hypothetical protein n=1 Tax=Bradyrhizobium sp. BR 1433 TaxID=3447967 RepID=UPI003EE697AE
MSSFDCAQHTFVEAQLVQRSTAVNVPQRVAFGGEAIADPAIDDNAISASHARVIAVDIAIRLIFGCSRARHSCMQIEPTGDDTTRPCEMIALSNPDRAIAPPQPCDTMPRHGRSAAVRTGPSPILAIP